MSDNVKNQSPFEILQKVANDLPTPIIATEFFKRAEDHLNTSREDILAAYEYNLRNISNSIKNDPETYASTIYKYALSALQTKKVNLQDISISTKKILNSLQYT